MRRLGDAGGPGELLLRRAWAASQPLTLPGLPQAGPAPCQACGRLAASTAQAGEGVPRRAEHSCPQRLEGRLKRTPILQQKQDFLSTSVLGTPGWGDR